METENKENISQEVQNSKKSEMLLIVGDEGADKVSQSKTSLQENFQKFRKQKQEQIKQQQYIKKANMQNRKSPEFKAALRQKFIDQAKKYFGIPYAARYWKPGEKHYNAPLYLDCCALIRRVLLDLAQDFGFTIGRWNQCYQYDTLPIDLKEEEMKPGDLVFYTATYYNDSWKPQKHDMVHVEIFYGGETGQASIGARWQRGVVQIFDSYKFKSTAYYNIKFHYKSIDTWLEGICKSWCPEHSWKISSLEWMPGKKSIFASDEPQQEEQDMFAPAGMEDTSDQGNETQFSTKPTFYVGEGNGDEFIKEILTTNMGWTAIPSEDDVNDKFRLKWTQLANGINYFNFKEGQQIVNHIPNSNVLIGKNMLYQRMEDLTYLIKDGYYTPTSKDKIEVQKFWPRAFRLDSVASRLEFLKHAEENSEGYWWARKAISNWTGVRFVENITEFASSLKLAYNLELKEEESSEQGQEQKQEKKIDKKIKDYSFIQKVPTNVLTLNNNNRCDMRCFMLVASTRPKYAVFMYKQPLFKASLEPLNSEENQQIVNITNFYIQKKHPDSQTRFEDHNPTPEHVYSEITKKCLKYEGCDQFMEELSENVRKIMRNVFESVRTRFQRKFGFFELFSFDFALEIRDQKIHPVLMDVITNPRIQFGKECLIIDTKMAQQVVRGMMPGALQAVVKIHESTETAGDAIEKEAKEIETKGFKAVFLE